MNFCVSTKKQSIMKKIFILTILTSIGLTCAAQSFIYSTDQHINIEMAEPFAPHYINFSTIEPQEITYKYERISNSMNEEWDLTLCDYQNCFQGIPETGTMTLISMSESESGKEGFFNLAVNNKEIEGQGLVEIYVYEADNYENGDTVSWNLTFGSLVSTKDLEVQEFFDVFPNPTMDIINISSEGYQSGSIYNSIGTKVMNLKSSTNKSINVSNLSNGVYVISLQDQFGKSYIKQFVIQ